MKNLALGCSIALGRAYMNIPFKNVTGQVLQIIRLNFPIAKVQRIKNKQLNFWKNNETDSN